MQNVNKSEYEREKSNRIHENLFQGSSNLLYVRAFTAMKDFH